MSGRISVSHRRSDAANATGRLVDELKNALGEDEVFFGHRRYSVGDDFVDELERRIR